MNHLDVVRLLGLDAPKRPEDDAYGRVVPEDFELLVQAVPAGVFAGSVLLERPGSLPVRSLEEFTRPTSLRIGDMELSLRSREQRLWLPLHPEPGGMVPWGRTATDGVLLWDATAADTADWTTVVTDDDFQLWLDLPFSASEFIARALLGRAEGMPAFETIEEYEAGSFWSVADDMPATATVLSNPDVGAVEELVTRIRNIGVPGIRQYARELVDRAVERARESTLVFPEDYLTVMREFPGGVIAGMRVLPVARAGWLTEDTVFLQWGELDGRAFGWLALTGDPQEWRVGYVEPGGTSLTHLHDQTFSSFLRRRLRGDNSLF
ncbi:hypothetical protein [Streptomyces sp. NPDC046712]|uniref:hypothetical protein n=1 Tax=Streptomyces sp. NPDC046712 TaxID=3154802 RepID=UPI0033C80C5D